MFCELGCESLGEIKRIPVFKIDIVTNIVHDYIICHIMNFAVDFVFTPIQQIFLKNRITELNNVMSNHVYL